MKIKLVNKKELPDVYLHHFEYHYARLMVIISDYARENEMDYEIFCNTLQQITTDAIGNFIYELIERNKMDEDEVEDLIDTMKKSFVFSVMSSLRQHKEGKYNGPFDCREHSDNS